MNGLNMKIQTLVPSLALAFIAIAAASGVDAAEERYAREYTCLPVNGSIQLPGIKYDDLTPLAREKFKSSPVAASDALYSLPAEEREDFLELYLEPTAREKHRYFFARCGEIAARKPVAEIGQPYREIIPEALRKELAERRDARLALHEGAIPFKIANRTVYIPLPEEYKIDEEWEKTASADEFAYPGYLAAFRKIVAPIVENGPVTDITARVDRILETGDTIESMAASYKTLVDSDWRITNMLQEDTGTNTAEHIDYKWNLHPFQETKNSFCYGQFFKSVEAGSASRISYKCTAIVILRGIYIHISLTHRNNTDLDVVNEMNAALVKWRDAVLTANWD